ncbi:ubiquitin carboxyl-terminal hydrolase CYLD-like [Rhopilema esculentum]|uniref:ubiquitin carboxyl-terminal hydrolase CYLD-like n=1 Tax=Rhopilema esculentum TaxID=499914 RepID=UPI0031E34534|eukprot:gene1606-16067_t
MDSEKRKYILRQDRPGKIVPRSKLGNVKKYLAEKTFNANDSFPALKGDLFQDGPDDEQPTDLHRILVSLIGDDSRILEVETGDLTEISNDVADLLLPIKDGYTRFELFSKRGFLSDALAAKVNDSCEVKIDGIRRKGEIKEIKTLTEDRPGKYFLVQLDDSKEESKHISMRKYENKVMTTVDHMVFNGPKTYSKDNKGRKASSTSIEPMKKWDNFETGKRVVVFVEDKPIKGTIKFIGKVKFLKDVQIGIELDSPKGSCDGTFHGQKLFNCKRNHGYFTEPSAILSEEDYYANPQDQFDIIEHEKERVSEGRKYKRAHSRNDIVAEQALQLIRVSQNQPSSLTRFIPAETGYFDSYFGEKNSYEDLMGNKNTMQVGKTNFTEDSPISIDVVPEDSAYRGYEEEFSKRRDAVSNEYRRPTDAIDPTLQVNSVVQVSIIGVAHYGVIRWIGFREGDPRQELLAGLELEEPSQFAGDGSLLGKRYFHCAPGRGFFTKHRSLKTDKRFASMAAPEALPANQDVEEVLGNFLPPVTPEEAPNGKMRGIQGHHNSCYLDATLFAMFAFSVAFDSVLYRKKRDNDIPEYEQVRNALKNAIVNPLRTKGFVNAASILRLRGWLDRLGNVQGFMNEEKDPEEFLMLLLKDVLKVDPFLKIRTNTGRVDASYFYQIWVEREEYNPVPTLQYLIELSFHTGLFYLEEVPSVFVVQLPRSGMQKVYKRIRVNRTLDISSVMTSASFTCLICENLADVSCRECCHSFGWEHPFIYFCRKCNDMVHQHSARVEHKVKKLPTQKENGYSVNKDIMKLELFAVVCIKTSHYVAFTKLGGSANEKWMFFDSMADRVGGEKGHNVPEVVECPEIKDWFDNTPLNFAESDSKNTPEKVLRLFEDASLCLYRSSPLSMYK